MECCVRELTCECPIPHTRHECVVMECCVRECLIPHTTRVCCDGVLCESSVNQDEMLLSVREKRANLEEMVVINKIMNTVSTLVLCLHMLCVAECCV